MLNKRIRIGSGTSHGHSRALVLGAVKKFVDAGESDCTSLLQYSLEI